MSLTNALEQTVLGVLTLPRLRKLADAFGIEVTDRRMIGFQSGFNR